MSTTTVDVVEDELPAAAVVVKFTAAALFTSRRCTAQSEQLLKTTEGRAKHANFVVRKNKPISQHHVRAAHEVEIVVHGKFANAVVLQVIGEVVSARALCQVDLCQETVGRQEQLVLADAIHCEITHNHMPVDQRDLQHLTLTGI